MYPDASIPIYQVSLQHSYDPAAHFALGRAIAPLRDDGVLIVGSGLSYHNLRLFGPGAKAPSAAFDAWLSTTMALPGASPYQSPAGLGATPPPPGSATRRKTTLCRCSPPLGAAEDELATRVYHDKNVFGGVTASSYRIG